MSEEMRPPHPDEFREQNLRSYDPPAGFQPTTSFNGDGPREKMKFKFISFDECKPQLESRYFLKGLIEPSQTSIIWGQSNVGKSFFVFELATVLGTAVEGETRFLGRRVRPCRVLYISAEGGSADLQNRAFALKKELGNKTAPIDFITHPVPIDSREAMKDLCEAIQERYKTSPDVPAVIIFDTLAACLFNADENSNGDASKVLGICRELSANLGGAHICLVHHTGHTGGRERGAYAWRANGDVSIELNRDYDSVDDSQVGYIEAHKVRSGRRGKISGFSLRFVSLGIDSDGDDVGTLVFKEEDLPESEAGGKKFKKLNSNQQVFYDRLVEFIAEHGTPMTPETGMPRVIGVSREAAQRHLIDCGQLDGVRNENGDEITRYKMTPNDRGRFRDMLSAFTVRGLMGSNKDFVWSAKLKCDGACDA